MCMLTFFRRIFKRTKIASRNSITEILIHLLANTFGNSKEIPEDGEQPVQFKIKRPSLSFHFILYIRYKKIIQK
jgi:hypothetical protein